MEFHLEEPTVPPAAEYPGKTLEPQSSISSTMRDRDWFLARLLGRANGMGKGIDACMCILQTDLNMSRMGSDVSLHAAVDPGTSFVKLDK